MCCHFRILAEAEINRRDQQDAIHYKDTKMKLVRHHKDNVIGQVGVVLETYIECFIMADHSKPREMINWLLEFKEHRILTSTYVMYFTFMVNFIQRDLRVNFQKQNTSDSVKFINSRKVLQKTSLS